MNLVAIPHTTWRCVDCDADHQTWPDHPCCRPDPVDERLLTLDEVADRVRVSKTTIQNWTGKGLLPAVRVGSVVRVRPVDLDAFLVEHT